MLYACHVFVRKYEIFPVKWTPGRSHFRPALSESTAGNDNWVTSGKQKASTPKIDERCLTG